MVLTQEEDIPKEFNFSVNSTIIQFQSLCKCVGSFGEGIMLEVK